MPLCVIVVFVMVYVVLVAPLMLFQPKPLFNCHWYVGTGLPVAATVKVAFCPAVTVWLVGCVVIVGDARAALTVSVATSEVTLPCEFDTTQRYR